MGTKTECRGEVGPSREPARRRGQRRDRLRGTWRELRGAERVWVMGCKGAGETAKEPD